MEFTVVSLLLTDGRASGIVGYERERGRFKVFNAGAVVLATGGAGRAYKITSNSWEGTGDGHALAYQAGADLMDMEFIQFHPTGMIWPPSVQGILVTEGVRGEGGVLRNKEGRRFMFDDIPEPYRNQTADNEDEGWRYVQGDKNARRPPELLTRDHVARCIMREVKAGRGSPHGGVFLDIAWIKEGLGRRSAHQAQAAEHVSPVQGARRYRHHRGSDGSRADDPLHHGRDSRRCGYADVDNPGLFAAGECAAGINGANRLGGNSLSDLLVFGKRAGEHAAIFVRDQPARAADPAQIQGATDDALKPFEHGAAGARTRTRPERPAGNDAAPGRHRPHRERNAGGVTGARRP